MDKKEMIVKRTLVNGSSALAKAVRRAVDKCNKPQTEAVMYITYRFIDYAISIGVKAPNTIGIVRIDSEAGIKVLATVKQRYSSAIIADFFTALIKEDANAQEDR